MHSSGGARSWNRTRLTKGAIGVNNGGCCTCWPRLQQRPPRCVGHPTASDGIRTPPAVTGLAGAASGSATQTLRPCSLDPCQDEIGTTLSVKRTAGRARPRVARRPLRRVSERLTLIQAGSHWHSDSGRPARRFRPPRQGLGEPRGPGQWQRGRSEGDITMSTGQCSAGQRSNSDSSQQHREERGRNAGQVALGDVLVESETDRTGRPPPRVSTRRTAHAVRLGAPDVRQRRAPHKQVTRQWAPPDAGTKGGARRGPARLCV
jgi:hypothetical protein